MAIFEGLSEKLNHIFSKMTKHGRLTELEIKQAMREVRIALRPVLFGKQAAVYLQQFAIINAVHIRIITHKKIAVKYFNLTAKNFSVFRKYYFFTRSIYSPVRVSIRITSPSFTNIGT